MGLETEGEGERPTCAETKSNSDHRQHHHRDRATQVESCIQTKGIKFCLEVGYALLKSSWTADKMHQCYLLLSSPFPSTVQPSGAVSFVLFREGAFFSLPLSQGDEREEERVRLWNSIGFNFNSEIGFEREFPFRGGEGGRWRLSWEHGSFEYFLGIDIKVRRILDTGH